MELICKREITVAGIPYNEDIQFIDNSQDIEAIKEHIGNPEWFDYGCIFVEAYDGEISTIYGCESNIPYNHYWVDTIEVRY